MVTETTWLKLSVIPCRTTCATALPAATLELPSVSETGSELTKAPKKLSRSALFVSATKYIVRSVRLNV